MGKIFRGMKEIIIKKINKLCKEIDELMSKVFEA